MRGRRGGVCFQSASVGFGGFLGFRRLIPPQLPMIMIVVLDILREVHSSERWDTQSFEEVGAKASALIRFLISAAL